MNRAVVALALWLFAGWARAEPAPVLVEPAWLAARLDDPAIVLIDMSEDDTQYRRFHLPGAVRLSYEQLLRIRPSDSVPVRLEDNALLALLGRLGIRREHHVVAYDDLGGLQAARLFWELERIGHPRVSVLEGGLVRWVLEGHRVNNHPVRRAPTVYRAGAERRDNEAVLADVRRAAEEGTALLLDVRSPEEYRGNGKPRTGHIPGARHWPWEQALDVERGFSRQPRPVLESALAATGLERPDRPVILYCRSGHRAAQTYLTLRSLGFEQVRLYANSINEYDRVAGAPLRQGQGP